MAVQENLSTQLGKLVSTGLTVDECEWGLMLMLKLNSNYLTDVANLVQMEKVKGTAQRLTNFLQAAATCSGLWWNTPLVGIDNLTQEVCLEWWNEGKKLTIYVDKEKTSFIKVWGADMDKEMEDGIVSSNNDLLLLWEWLCESTFWSFNLTIDV